MRLLFLLTVASQNGTLEDLRFLTGKGVDVSVRDLTTNSAVHFNAVAYIVDIIKLLLCINSVKLTKTDVFILNKFQLMLAICRQGKLLSKEVLLSTTLISTVTLH